MTGAISVGDQSGEMGTEDRARLLERLRAVSRDPVRFDLLDALRFEGPLSVPDLRRMVPDARRGLQAHLRDLAKGEWVQCISGEGRTAVWAALRAGVEWAESSSQDPEVIKALDELTWVLSVRRMDRQLRWREERDQGRWSQEWMEAWIGRDYTFRLTPNELDELDDRLAEVFDEFRVRSNERNERRHEAVSENDKDVHSELVFVTATAFPTRFGGWGSGRK